MGSSYPKPAFINEGMGQRASEPPAPNCPLQKSALPLGFVSRLSLFWNFG